MSCLVCLLPVYIIPPDSPARRRVLCLQGRTPRRYLGGIPGRFAISHRVPVEALDRARLDQYSVQPLPATPYLPQCVLWDAPDCDSVDASHYMAGLVEAVTLADVVVYVTSREKYAVEQILAWVVLLAEAGISRSLAAPQPDAALAASRDTAQPPAGARHGCRARWSCGARIPYGRLPARRCRDQ